MQFRKLASLVAATCLMLTGSFCAARAADTYAGVDFMASDHLRMPNYDLCRNLVQNPGFEQGLNFWHTGPLGKMSDSTLPDDYFVDEHGGINGSRALKIVGEKGQSPSHLATFAIPTVKGETYTLSFYAKADRPGLSVWSLGTSVAWGTWAYEEHAFPVTTDWKRYSLTFKSTNNVVAPDFGLNNDNAARGVGAGGTVWIDDVQLERGELTDYVEKPYGARLLTNSRNNLSAPGEDPSAKIELSGKPGGAGTVLVVVTDIGGQAVFSGSSKFSLGADGRSLLSQPWASKLGAGLYVVAMDIRATDGFADRVLARLTRMPSLTERYPNRDYFAYGGMDARGGDWERKFAYFNRIGLGSCIHFDPQSTAYKAVYRKYDVLSISSIFDGGERLCGWNLKDDFLNHLSDDDLAKIEDAAAAKASANLDVTYWKLINEPDGTHAPAPRKLTNDVDAMKVYIRMLAAARRGILRGNPKAIVISPDPAGMSPKGGIQWMETFLKAGGLSVADIIAVHPYRARPEDPDLDADIDTFYKMLDANGYHGEVWFTEGGGNSMYEIPAYGLDVYRTLGQDAYRAGALTYDVGWAERLSTAYCERQWLIGMKYRPRLRQYIDWYISGNSSIDRDMTPGLIAFAPNALGRLLGDASYVRDIALGEDLRAYEYKDGQGRPIVALWTCDLAGDHGDKTGPVLRLNKLPGGCEAFDMVGAPIDIGDRKLRLGPLPVFLRGPRGTVDAIGTVVESAPMVSGGNRLRIWPEVTGASEAVLHVQNRTRKSIGGTIAIEQAGHKSVPTALSLAGNVTTTLPLAVASGEHGLAATITYKPDDGGDPQISKVDVPVYVTHELDRALVIDGDLADWPQTDAVSVPNLTADFSAPPGTLAIPYKGPNDLSASIYTAYDSDTFYFAAHVVDDVFNPSPAGKASYLGDGLQIYFDCFADGRSRKELGFNGDDEAFSLWPDLTTPVLERTQAPDWQIAFTTTGVVKGTKVAVKRTADGYNVEAAIPASELVPLKLKAGTVFGFAALVNDNDGDYRKRGATMTPTGTEPFGRPDLYPLFVMGR